MRSTVMLFFTLTLVACYSFSEAALPKASLKSVDPAAMVSKTADSVKLAAEAMAKRKNDSLKASAEAAKQKSKDSLKAIAAELEKKGKDTLNAAMGKKKTAKAAPATPPPAPVAKVAPAQPAPAAVVAVAPEPTPKPAASGCSVTKLVLASKIENREPSGEGKEFPAGQVACWARIACGSAPMTINYVWSKDGKKVYDIPISMKHSGRSWCRANLSAGNWTVSLVKDGAEIGSGVLAVK